MDIGRYTLSARQPNRWGRIEWAFLTGLPREVAALCDGHAPVSLRQVRELEAALVVAQRVYDELAVLPLDSGPANGCLGRCIEDAADDSAVARALGTRRATQLRVRRPGCRQHEACTDERSNGSVAHDRWVTQIVFGRSASRQYRANGPGLQRIAAERITCCAASRPLIPLMNPPGCVPAPQRKTPRTGAL